MRFGLLVVLCCAVDCAAATASGRNWRLAIDSLACDASTITVGTRIRYLGPKGPVEAPIIQLSDGAGARQPPKSLIWKGGSKPLAEWLSAGGLYNVQSEDLGEVQLKFEMPQARSMLRLEFGDIRAFALTAGGEAGCSGLLKPDQVQAPRVTRQARAESAKLRVYRNAYPCRQTDGTSRTVEAQYPAYLPRQLLLFGRGYLPNARQVELPMGQAPAQPYAYSGPDELKAIEDATRRALANDFPHLAAQKHFVFNWGVQKAASGNEAYSVGVYDVRACPK